MKELNHAMEEKLHENPKKKEGVDCFMII